MKYICAAKEHCDKKDCHHATPHDHDDLKGCGNNTWCTYLTPKAITFLNEHKEVDRPHWFKPDTPLAKLEGPYHAGILHSAIRGGADLKYPGCVEVVS